MTQNILLFNLKKKFLLIYILAGLFMFVLVANCFAAVIPTISISSPSATLTKAGPVTYTVTYAGADIVTLSNADVTLIKTGTANGTVAVSGSGSTTRTVTINGISGDGTLGISLVAATASDTAGNTSAAAGPSTTFTVDNTAPTVSVSPIAGLFNATQIVTLTPSEAGTIYYTNDDSTPTKSSAVYLTPLTISSSTVLKYTEFDTAANQSPVYSQQYNIDKIAPTFTATALPALSNGQVTVKVVSNKQLITQPTVYASFALNPFIQMQLTYDYFAPLEGTYGTYYFTANVSNQLSWTSGDYNVMVSCTDIAGNISPDTNAATFTVDNTPPSISIDTLPDYTNTRLVYVTGNCEDLTSGMSNIRLDGGQSSVYADIYSSTKTFAGYVSFPSNGQKTITAVAYDTAGNSANVATTFTIDTSDTESPTLTVTTLPELTNGPVTLKVYSSEALQNTPAIAVYVNTFYNVAFTFSSYDALANTYYFTGNVASVPLPLAPTQIIASGTDLSGNATSATFDNIFTIDNTAPSVSIATPTEAQVLGSSGSRSFTVTGQVTDASTSDAAYLALFIDGQEYPGAINADKSFSAFVTKTLDGPYALSIHAKDTAGNVGPSVIRNITLDTSSPVLDVTQPLSEAIFNTNQITVTGSATDLTNQTIKVNGTTVATCIAPSVSFNTYYDVASDGIYSLTVSSTDAAGHITSAAPITAYVDKTAPSITIAQPSDGSTSSTTTVHVAGSYVDALVNGYASGVAEVKLVNPETTAFSIATLHTGTKQFEGDITVNEGTGKTIQVFVKDNAGNVFEKTITINVNTPLATLTVITDKSIVKGGETVNVTVYSNQELQTAPNVAVKYLADNSTNNVTMAFQGNDGTNYWWDGSYTLSNQASKTGYVEINASGINLLDKACSGVNSIIFDATAPVISIDSPTEAALLSSGNVTITGSASDETSISAVYVNGQQVTPSGNSYTLGLTLGEGNQVITVTGIDTAGNVTTVTRNIHIDTVAPTLTIASPTQDTTLGSKTVTIGGTAFDAVSAVNVEVTAANATVSNVTYDGISYSAQVTFVSDGPFKSIDVKATDAVGHVTTKTVSFAIDASGPEITVDSPVSGLKTNATSTEVIVSSEDAMSAVATVQINDTVVTKQVDGKYHYTWNLSNGKNTLTVSATDSFGNTNTFNNFSVAVHNEAPVITMSTFAQPHSLGIVDINLDVNEDDLLAVPTASITFSDASTQALTLNGGGLSYSTAFNITSATPNGTATVSVVANDVYGNTSTTETSLVVDTIEPTVTASSPLAGTTSVSISAYPTITFSEAIKQSTLNTNNFKITSASGQVYGTITYNSTSLTATFEPSQPLNFLTSYTINLNGITDVAGNLISPLSSSFTTIEGVKIGLIAINPIDGIFSPLNGPIKISFNTTKLADVKLLVYRGATLVRTITSLEQPAGDGEIVWDGKDDEAKIVSSGIYTCMLTATENTYTALLPSTFEINVDLTPPVVVQVLPENNAGNVAVTQTISVVFSEAVLNADKDENFDLLLDGGPVDGLLLYNPSTQTMTFSAQKDFQEGATYTIKIKNGITDIFGNQFSEKTYQFTIGDFTAPTIAITKPLQNASLSGIVYLEAHATDNLGVQSVNFLYSDNNGSTWKSLAVLNTVYLGNEKDGLWKAAWNTKTANLLSKNIIIRAVALDKINSSQATANVVIDNTPPVIQGLQASKRDYSPSEINAENITYTVSEDANVTVQLLTKQGGLLATTLVSNQPVEAGKVSFITWHGYIDNNTSLGLIEDGDYLVSVKATDSAGNTSDNVSPLLYEITVDKTKPSSSNIVILAPLPREFNVSPNTWPSVVFPENIDPATINNGSFVLTDVSVGENFPCSVSYNAQTRNAYLKSNSHMQKYTTYKAILRTTVTDLAGNPLDNEFSWQFTTGFIKDAPIVNSFHPDSLMGMSPINIAVTDDTYVSKVSCEYSLDNIYFTSLPSDGVLSSGTHQSGNWHFDWNTEGLSGLCYLRFKCINADNAVTIYNSAVNILKSQTTVIEKPTVNTTINLLENKVTISVPADIFSDPVKISAAVVPVIDIPKVSNETKLVSDVFNFSALTNNGDAVHSFIKPLEITFSYDLSDMDYLDENTAKLYYFNPTTREWEAQQSSIDTSTKTITAQITHFSQYAVFAEGKHIYLPTPKYRVVSGNLVSRFNPDGKTSYPFEIYLPNEIQPWNYRIHSNYTKNTDACASCHSTHTAVGNSLLQSYTVYDTCMSCHDGTVSTTYNVMDGTIGTSNMPTFGGAFGTGIEMSLSRHNVRGGVRIASAQGGVQDAVYDSMGKIISWQLDFGCESCHSPHGQGGNARLLNPDPNGAALRNALNADNLSDYRVGYTKNVDDWTKVSDSVENLTLRTIKYAVYPYRPFEGKLKRDLEEKPLTWIKGYPYVGGETEYTKITDKVYPGGIPLNRYKIDNSNGYTHIVFTQDSSNPSADDYIPDEATMRMSFVASVHVDMNITNFLQENERVQLGTGINYFCASCHQDYNTVLRQLFDESTKTYTYSPPNLTLTQHRVGQWLNKDETLSAVYNGKTFTIDKIRFEKDPWGNTNTVNGQAYPLQIVNCLSCHFAHGTSQETWQRNFGSLSILDFSKQFTNVQLTDQTNYSALKRLPNDLLCNECHPDKPERLTQYPRLKTIPTQATATYTGLQAGNCGGSSCHPKQYQGWTSTMHYKALMPGISQINSAAVINWAYDSNGNGPGTLFNPSTLTNFTIQDIVYIIGQKWSQSYIVLDDGYLRPLPYQWDVTNSTWIPKDVSNWRTHDFNVECVTCHTSGYNLETNTFKDAGVACESCHGPASEHKTLPSELNITPIYNLSAAKQVDICGQCHIKGINKAHPERTDAYGFKPGQNYSLLSVIYPYSYDGRQYYSLTEQPNGMNYPSINDITYMNNGSSLFPNSSKLSGNEFTEFIQSKHYLSKKVNCTTCHNPHGVNDRGSSLKTSGQSICATCHDTLGSDQSGWDKYIADHMPLTIINPFEYYTKSHLFN